MAEEQDSGEKSFEPSQRRLDEARQQGDLVRSNDLTTTAAQAGLSLFALTAGATSLLALAQVCKVLLDQSDRLSELWFDQATAPLGGLMAAIVMPLLPLFLIPAGAALLALFAQQALVFAPEKIQPKLSRISPFQGFVHKFGPEGLFEFGKSAVKLVLFSLALAWFLTARADQILGSMYLEPGQSTALLGQILLDFLFLVVLMTVVIAGIDYAWQRYKYLSRHRMTRQEMIEEHKDQEGDPHTKSQRRQRAVDIATNQMLADVPSADVVIVNPTHYAVALKWDRRSGRAPVCVAKGVDEIAARIREKAAVSGVPLHRDPPTARAIHATVEIGQEIRQDHYRAVAAALRFAEAMRRKARARGFR